MNKISHAFTWFLLVMLLPALFGFQYQPGPLLGALVIIALVVGAVGFFHAWEDEIEFKRFYGGDL